MTERYTMETIAAGYCYDMETGEIIDPPPELCRRLNAALERSYRAYLGTINEPIKDQR